MDFKVILQNLPQNWEKGKLFISFSLSLSLSLSLFVFSVLMKIDFSKVFLDIFADIFFSQLPPSNSTPVLMRYFSSRSIYLMKTQLEI